MSDAGRGEVVTPSHHRIGLHGVPVGRVDRTGTVELEGRRARIGWWVAADDRWHDPRTAPSIRQRRLDGAPVVETKLAVPGGDVIQTSYCVADHDGLLVVRYENTSPAAVAVAVPTIGAVTTAATPGTPPQGIELPGTVRAFPLAHGGSLTFAWSLRRARWWRRSPIDTGRLAPADQVIRGWINACERASRIPDAADRLTSGRCTVLMAAPRELDDLLGRDPAVGVVAVAERVRMGDPGGPWVEQVADAVRRLAKRPSESSWTSRAVSLAAFVLAGAHETRAVDDVLDIWRTLPDAPRTTPTSLDGPSDLRGQSDELQAAVVGLAAVEDRLARPVGPDALHLLSDGVTPWLGSNVEAHGLHAGPHHRVSFALRWHGENAALLWEVDGPPGMRLAAPTVDRSFSTSDAQGETLLRVTR